jgi:hypothetical protein
MAIVRGMRGQIANVASNVNDVISGFPMEVLKAAEN